MAIVYLEKILFSAQFMFSLYPCVGVGVCCDSQFNNMKGQRERSVAFWCSGNLRSGSLVDSVLVYFTLSGVKQICYRLQTIYYWTNIKIGG